MTELSVNSIQILIHPENRSLDISFRGEIDGADLPRIFQETKQKFWTSYHGEILIKEQNNRAAKAAEIEKARVAKESYEVSKLRKHEQEQKQLARAKEKELKKVAAENAEKEREANKDLEKERRGKVKKDRNMGVALAMAEEADSKAAAALEQARIKQERKDAKERQREKESSRGDQVVSPAKKGS